MSLSRRTALALPGALPLALLAGRAAAQKRLEIPPSWYAVRIDENAFIVEMPGVPDHRIVDDRSARGTAFQLHSYSIESGGSSYVAQTALYPADVDVTQPRAILQAALDGRAQQLSGGKWSRVQWREIAGAAAVESTGVVPGGNGLRQLVLLKQRRFMSLAFLGNASSLAGADANRFFNSLKLV
ncbi:MAG: hypothetical protein JSR24_12850 [Proteobacteria bacterium]|nr:hypothetical protein [Pseudomonadota bacterium]